MAELDLDEFIKTPFVLLTGIANPSTLCAFLDDKNATYSHQSFADHHNFTVAEIAALRNLNQPILTTEKDAARLAPHKLAHVYTLGVGVRFLEGEDKFLDTVVKAIAM